MKLLTVTVPCYNSQDYMEKCIDSILVGGEQVEIIIIDDGSKDNTGVIADRYAEQYPNIVKVVHQENGGHGEGINQGLKRATGRYFKTVDSDDTLADFPLFLAELARVDKLGGVDVFITNYHYVHADGIGDRSIVFSNALPQNRIFTWDETRPFRADQILMIHTCTFRTELLHQTGLEMPKHMFYEDNYMIYGNMRHVEKLYYLNMDLYQYFIGRADQSVQQSAMMRRCSHQIRSTELCFTCYHLDEIKSKRKKAYLRYELFIMFGISIVFTRLNRTEEAEEQIRQMWRTCEAFDPKWAKHFQKKTPLALALIPGKAGNSLVSTAYALAHRIVRFN